MAFKLAISASFLLVAYVLRLLYRKKHLRLPPGPRGLPVIGNVLDLPQKQQGLEFYKLGMKYGDVVYLSVIGQPIIILNSQKACAELLDKKSSIYSDRPNLPMAGELVGWDRGIPLGQSSPRLREMRKQLHSFIGGRSVENFNDLLEQEVFRFLRKLCEEPAAFVDHAKWIMGNVILRITYGYKVTESKDPEIAKINRVMEEFSKSAEPGKWIVDIIPALRHLPEWFPGASFKRIAKQYKTSGSKIIIPPYERAKSSLMNEPNFVRTTLSSYTNPTPEVEDMVMWSAVGLYGGGSDTTVSVVSTFILAMSKFPEVQKIAQNEIDYLISSENRLPMFKDRAQLPYLNALIKEVLRWKPVAPTGIPHCLVKDDEYRGWLIPRGSLVIANIWGICKDEKLYPSPALFNPSRFLGDNPEPDPYSSVFGYGRRICPGLSFANQTLFIVISGILAVFDISSSELEEDIKYTDGTVSHPEPFKCTIKPRSEHAKSLIFSV